MLDGLDVGCIACLCVCFPVPLANAENTLQAADVEGIVICRRYGIQLSDP